MSNKNYIIDKNICGPDFDMCEGVKVSIKSYRDNDLECFENDEYYKNLKLVIVEVIEDFEDLVKGDIGEFLFDDKKGIFVSY